MAAGITTPASRRRSAGTAAVLCGLLAAGGSAVATAQQVANPGDIIVERDITARSAFDSVPTSQDPVTVRATTFPKNSFDPAIAQLVSDADLTNARGSSGVDTGSVLGGTVAGLQSVTRILVGSPTGAGPGVGPGAQGGGGIGATISSSVTGAIAPLTSALGALK